MSLAINWNSKINTGIPKLSFISNNFLLLVNFFCFSAIIEVQFYFKGSKMKKLLLLIAMLASLAFGAVDINTASKEELMSLKGIGAAKAEAIIAARPFTSTDEIKKVKGIGEGIYNNIKDEIIVK